MFRLKHVAMFLLVSVFLGALALPAFAIDYFPGVTVGQYVKYGNFVGVGPGTETVSETDWLKLQVTDVSGKTVTLLSTSQYKNGTAVPGNGSSTVWNIETGTEDGVQSTLGPIIASNLNQGDAIPPPNTFSVNRTENRVYLGVSRTVNIVDVSVSSPSYNTTLFYVYDRASGMLLESTTQTTTQAEPEPVATIISYSITETNIFSSLQTPSPTVPELTVQAIVLGLLILTAVVGLTALLRKRKT